MSDTPKPDFITQAEALILKNVANEQFGVSELAEAMHMSRSNLLRKIKKANGLSASQFIREVRLTEGMKLLKETSQTVSEISYQVGFGSNTYFIKCFREYYGIPPGEARNRKEEPIAPLTQAPTKTRGGKIPTWLGIVTGLIGLALIYFFILKKEPATPVAQESLDKSIAVLPFKNDSNDSSNLYFVNGLMESTLGNLQKIEDLRVISRTSSEKYRNTNLSAPEIGEELNVSYIVEGSGQKLGDQVMLNIQLIDASTDTHIWAQQYNREIVDIFTLQNEVAQQIAEAIQAIVTPAELEQIEKIPTENMEAYDYYLQALDPYYARTKEGLLEGIPLFEKAIELDPEFALAYASVAISYYFLDMNQAQLQYTEEINNYADKALLYDSKLTESLIAKALYYLQTEEYRLAVPHLEKALEYNPNSTAVIQILSDIYARLIPNTAKYLEYALKGIQLDAAVYDSSTRSYTHLHLSNAFVQNGFVEEAVEHINLSLAYNPENYFAPFVKAMVLHARDQNLEQTTKRLLTELKKDTTRLDIAQETAKFYFYQGDYENAYAIYRKFVNARSTMGLDIFKYEDGKIGYVYEQMGLNAEAQPFYDSYAEFCEQEESIYKSISTAALYSHLGRLDEAIEQMNAFAAEDNYQYWVLLFLEHDPLFEPVQSHPDYPATFQSIKDNFWEDRANLKASLEAKGLL